MKGTGYAVLQYLGSWLNRKPVPLHLQAGQLGEKLAKRYLKEQGLKFLTANFRTERGEIDLVMRDEDCLHCVYFTQRNEGSIPNTGSRQGPPWILERWHEN